MAENVSRQTGHCMAGDGGWLDWTRLLLCEATGEDGETCWERGGESVRSMVSSSL